jgi:hypothetical protein
MSKAVLLLSSTVTNEVDKVRPSPDSRPLAVAWARGSP